MLCQVGGHLDRWARIQIRGAGAWPVNRLEEEARIGKAGTLAVQLSRLDVVVLDELGYTKLRGF